MLEAHLRKVQLSCETIQPQRMEDLCQRRPTGDSAAQLKLPLGSNSGLSDHMSGQHIHLRDSQIVRQHPSIDRSCFVYSQRAYLCFSDRNMLKSRCNCLIPVPLEKMRDHFLRAVFCKGSSPCCRFPPCYAMFIVENHLLIISWTTRIAFMNSLLQKNQLSFLKADASACRMRNRT